MAMQVGTIVKLKIQMLNNSAGTIGICYETYILNNKNGSSFIFENGEYDGFSETEQNEYLELVKVSNFNYSFTNVIKLSIDFSNGFFNTVFTNIITQ